MSLKIKYTPIPLNNTDNTTTTTSAAATANIIDTVVNNTNQWIEIPTTTDAFILSNLFLSDKKDKHVGGAVTVPIEHDCVIEVNIRNISQYMHNNNNSTNNSTNSSKFKKQSWWLVLGSISTHELLAIKRISISSHITTALEFESPPEIRFMDHLCIYLVCDSVVGIDCMCTFTLKT
jgi:hypothetical protein